MTDQESINNLIYHLNKIIKKLPEFIQNIIDRLFNQCNIDLKHFKQQYDPEVKRKEESRFKGFNLFNKKEIEKATKHINDKMDEYAEEFYSNKKQKDDDLSLQSLSFYSYLLRKTLFISLIYNTFFIFSICSLISSGKLLTIFSKLITSLALINILILFSISLSLFL